jgi:transposase
MRNGISITVSRSDRRRLQALVADRNASQKHVWRAEIILLTADGLGTNEIMRRTAKSKTCVWRWQERFMEEGFEGLLRDKTRPSRIEPLKADVAERVVAMTLTDPPGETTHWTGAMMAEAIGISISSVQRIWRAHGLQPHREDESVQRFCAPLLVLATLRQACAEKAGLIVLKEFPASYRKTLQCFQRHGFIRLPSLPMTCLNIEDESFGDYMKRALSRAARKNLR